MPYIATIDILVDCDNEDEAIEAVKRFMDQPRPWKKEWCWLEGKEAVVVLIKTEPLPPNWKEGQVWPDMI